MQKLIKKNIISVEKVKNSLIHAHSIGFFLSITYGVKLFFLLIFFQFAQGIRGENLFLDMNFLQLLGEQKRLQKMPINQETLDFFLKYKKNQLPQDEQWLFSLAFALEEKANALPLVLPLLPLNFFKNLLEKTGVEWFGNFLQSFDNLKAKKIEVKKILTLLMEYQDNPFIFDKIKNNLLNAKWRRSFMGWSGGSLSSFVTFVAP